jgi:hypothetical protein
MGRTEIPWRSVLRAAPGILAVALLVVRSGARLSRRFQILWLAGALVLFLVPRGITWWSRRRVKSWPWTYAFIEFAKVAEDPKGGPSDYVLELSYSYLVDGARYGGAYRESFRSEDQAKKSLRFFENLPYRSDTIREILRGPFWTRTGWPRWQPGLLWLEPRRASRRTGPLSNINGSFAGSGSAPRNFP